jgi:hypothetical protein
MRCARSPHTHAANLHSCAAAAWLKRSPDTATPDVRQFQLHLIESGTSICNRNRIMTVRFCSASRYVATIWRPRLAHQEPERPPPVLSPEEVKRVPTMATSLKARAIMLAYAAGCVQRGGAAASRNINIPSCYHSVTDFGLCLCPSIECPS